MLLTFSDIKAHVQRFYGHRISVHDGPGGLFAYGSNTSASQSGETVWETGGFETYPTDNTINEVQSSSGADTMDVDIIGCHLLPSGNIITIEQTVTLTGSTPVTLPTPLFRAESIGITGNEVNSGTLTVTSPAGTHLTVPAGDSWSLKAAITVPSDHYLLLTNIGATLWGGNNADTQFIVELREKDHTWRPAFHLSSRGSGTSQPDTYFDPPPVIPPNTDLRIDAYPSGNNISVTAGIFGVWAKVLDWDPAEESTGRALTRM